MEFAAWLNSGNVWLVIGLLLAALELAHGSMAFFLPMGLGGLLTGALLKMQEAALLPSWLPLWLPDWAWTMAFWAVVSLLFSVLLSQLTRKKAQPDINEY